jgi:hypothetical protein
VRRAARGHGRQSVQGLRPLHLQEAIAVYSSDELAIDEGGSDNNVKLKDWLIEGRRQLDSSREALRYLCEPVPPPRGGFWGGVGTGGLGTGSCEEIDQDVPINELFLVHVFG